MYYLFLDKMYVLNNFLYNYTESRLFIFIFILLIKFITFRILPFISSPTIHFLNKYFITYYVSFFIFIKIPNISDFFSDLCLPSSNIYCLILLFLSYFILFKLDLKPKLNFVLKFQVLK